MEIEKTRRLRWPGPRVAAMGILAVAVVTVIGHQWLNRDTAPRQSAGTAPAAAPQPAAAAPSGPLAAHEIGSEQIAPTVARLAARLEKQPDDADGWAMLARSYAVTQQHDKAVPAFRKALALRGDDAALLADFADSLAMTRQRKLAGEPIELVQRALKADPNQLKALSLAGTEAFDRKDYKAALAHWEKLQQVAPPDSPLARQVQGVLQEVRKLAGEPPAATGAKAAPR